MLRWRSVTRWFAAAAAPNSALGVTPSWRRATHVAWLRRGPLTTIWNTCLLGNREGFNGFCKWTIIVGHKGLLKLWCLLLNLASPRWLHAKRAQLCGPTHRGTGETPAEERESESQSESQIQIQAGWFGLIWMLFSFLMSGWIYRHIPLENLNFWHKIHTPLWASENGTFQRQSHEKPRGCWSLCLIFSKPSKPVRNSSKMFKRESRLVTRTR